MTAFIDRVCTTSSQFKTGVVFIFGLTLHTNARFAMTPVSKSETTTSQSVSRPSKEIEFLIRFEARIEKQSCSSIDRPIEKFRSRAASRKSTLLVRSFFREQAGQKLIRKALRSTDWMSERRSEISGLRFHRRTKLRLRK